MKCPSCGAEIVSGKVCRYCGTQISAEMLRNIEILNKVGCPRCNSTNVSFNRENQGEIRGKNGKRIVHYTVGVCKDCGYTWRTDASQPKPKRKTWLWVLGWIYCFPIPLTIILLKKKELKPILKYGIIAAAWLLFIGFFVLIGNSTNDTANTIEQPGELVMTIGEKYVLTGEELGEYGREVILNADTDMPTSKYLYKLPAGNYIVTTTNEKFSSFYIVKDNITTEDNPEYPEILQYVSNNGYLLTAGEDDLNGNAAKSVTVTLLTDESFQLVGTDTFIFEKID